MTETLADRLAAFALATRFDDLPDAVVAEARRRLLDAFGCAAGALDEPAPTIARKAAPGRPVASRGRPCSAAGGRRPTGRRSPTASTSATSTATTRISRSSRPTRATTGPPIMAVGEHVGADGRAWIAAAAVAYEVQCRPGRRREHPGPGLGPRHLRGPVDLAGRLEAARARPRAGRSTRWGSPGRPRRRSG